MGDLDSIPVIAEGGRTANLKPLLREIRQALGELIDSGRETAIDVSAMPFSEQDEADLRAQLGVGEVSAVLDAYGPTKIHETAISGVWWVEHRDAEDRRLTLHLQIARIPAILVTPLEDLDDGLDRLRVLVDAMR